MKNKNVLSIRTKILLGAIVAVSLTVIASMVTVYWIASSNRVDELHKGMSSTLKQAELTKLNMDDFYQHKAFDMEHLLADAKATAGTRSLKEAYRETTLYTAIPVVAAWNSVKEATKTGNLEFFTPSKPGIPAVNSGNNNGINFQQAFDDFAKGQEESFYRDPKSGRYILARSVKLTSSCLTCHGDPANSPTHDGKNVIGFPMENMKTGDIKGAFILSATMRNDEVVQATMGRIGVVGSIILLVVIAGFYFLNRRFIIRPLSLVIDSITQGAMATDNASSEVSSSSFALADGASRQAAALEETSSALEEISSMTKRNSATATQASQLSTHTNSAAVEGNASMQKMAVAIKEIEKSANETAKIIKVIDEIAFQTNLLALNAAVEAARAGDAGKGFAVVAGEVRNLAQRSAEAAKTTSELIQQSVGSAHNGATIANLVEKSLIEITQATNQVAALVGEIASSSQEQTQGIEQVNKAVSEMDQVTQSNAAAAEESASAAKELSSQSHQLKDVVINLRTLVGTDAGANT